MSYMDKASEDDFNAWLDSIDLVDEEGVVIDYELEFEDDDSSDPEGDRG